MHNKQFLVEYLNGTSPSGFEKELGGQKIWKDYVSKFATKVEQDAYGNVFAFYKSSNASDDIVLLDAHADEIAFVVTQITKEGYIKVARLGGSDEFIAAATRVNIHTRKETVKGVFGHPAVHVHKHKHEATIQKLFIDTGFNSKEEVEELGIEIGNPVTMEGEYQKLGHYHCGKSLDDKIGGYINAMVLEELILDQVELPFTLCVVNTVQEEVGLKGAQIAANYLKPKMTIAIDVTHDTESPAYDASELGDYQGGKGPVILTGPSIQKDLFNYITKTAKKNDIDIQIIASGVGSGTNADAYAYPNGTPTALIKMAMKYMHTTVEMVHEDDVDNTIALLYNVVSEYKFK